jgi:hypothetical protein
LESTTRRRRIEIVETARDVAAPRVIVDEQRRQIEQLKGLKTERQRMLAASQTAFDEKMAAPHKELERHSTVAHQRRRRSRGSGGRSWRKSTGTLRM